MMIPWSALDYNEYVVCQHVSHIFNKNVKDVYKEPLPEDYYVWEQETAVTKLVEKCLTPE